MRRSPGRNEARNRPIQLVEDPLEKVPGLAIGIRDLAIRGVGRVEVPEQLYLPRAEPVERYQGGPLVPCHDEGQVVEDGIVGPDQSGSMVREVQPSVAAEGESRRVGGASWPEETGRIHLNRLEPHQGQLAPERRGGVWAAADVAVADDQDSAGRAKYCSPALRESPQSIPACTVYQSPEAPAQPGPQGLRHGTCEGRVAVTRRPSPRFLH